MTRRWREGVDRKGKESKGHEKKERKSVEGNKSSRQGSGRKVHHTGK